MIETLVATTIITTSLFGAMSVFLGVSNLTRVTAQSSVAASLARRGIEEAKNKGFANLTDGTTTQYFDKDGATVGASVNTGYAATTVISTDIVTSGVPDKTALRTVVVTVKRSSDNTVLETAGTYLAWGGP